MAAMEELAAHLQSLQALKPPGVTPTKVKAITQLCVDNIQSETAVIQKILLQFHNSAATHKLGVLYVVDSVIRQWLEKAKQAGQAISKSAAPGTFASGVQLMRDVLPVLLNNLIQSAPENQRPKILKLIDIWERGQTFPPDMLANFKVLVNGQQTNIPAPPRSPPKSSGGAMFPPVANQQPAPIPAVVPPVASSQPSNDPSALFAALAGFAQQNASTNAAPIAPPSLAFSQNMVPPPPGYLPPQPPTAVTQPINPPSVGGSNDLAAQILQAISTGLIAPDQAVQVLNAMAAAQNGGLSLPASQAPAAIAPQTQIPFPIQHTMQTNAQPSLFERDEGRYRNRSRSPDYHRPSPPRRSPPNINRRESPVYGAYDPSTGTDGNSMNRSDRNDRGRGRGKQRGGRNDRNDYRQRSPARRQPSPPRAVYGDSKYIEWDNTLPPGNIKVLSRTLFVGGAAGTEGEIRSIFSRFGRVQTCIVNQDKRHAFVKMMTRPDAVAAKDGMDNLQDPAATSKARQTRWGVGFGPRDCSDYTTGISIIPIERLTDADLKWALTAEHGGTGGRQLEGGMVLEEPDIEIGAGVSSKAISRRVMPDGGRGGRGGFGNRSHADHGSSKARKFDRPAHDPRHIEPRAEQVVAVPPAVPGFGFQLPGF